jgi:hypothetical protein
MIKTVLMATIILLILVMIGGQSTVKYVYHSETSENLEFQAKSDTPEIALKNYWRASFLGNKGSLNEMSLPPEEFWWDGCELQKEVESTTELSTAELISDEDKFSHLRQSEKDRLNNSKQLQIDSIDFVGANISDGIRYSSEYIWASKVEWKRFRVVSKQVYNNEAFLKVEIADSYGNFTKSTKHGFGFKKVGEEWKLIDTFRADVLGFIDYNFKYGTEQSVCK